MEIIYWYSCGNTSGTPNVHITHNLPESRRIINIGVGGEMVEVVMEVTSAVVTMTVGVIMIVLPHVLLVTDKP